MIIHLAYIMLSPFLWLAIYIASFLNKKIRLRMNSYKFLLNNSIVKAKQTNKEILVFHAASNGELEQLKPIFRLIDRNKYFVMLTISSPSSYNHIPLNLLDTFSYQAFDFPWTVYNFFKKIKPHKYIITRHDIWPNHLFFSKWFCKDVYLINANLPEKSKRLFPVIRSFYKYIFSFFTCIYTVSESMKTKLTNIIDDDKINVIGDTRLDQIEYRYENKKMKLPLFENSKNILFGSIDEYDIKLIFDYLKIRKNNSRLIFVPHEPDEKFIINIERKLKELSIDCVRFSNMTDNLNQDNLDAIIIDKVGILADAYQFSSISYIGCGFGKGVHNVMEPAIYGNLICFGPNYQILDEAIELVNEKLAIPINNSNELTKVLDLIFKEDTLEQHKNDLKKFISKKQNISNQILRDIL
tara:strand:+ start:72 stop:1304 length:1233 start_codon:yes stop_codon:yes gene_type:complete